jgi:hypothetical protein
MRICTKEGGQDDWIGAVGVLLLVAGTLIAAYEVLSPRWQIKISLRTPLSQPAIMPPAESADWHP